MALPISSDFVKKRFPVVKALIVTIVISSKFVKKRVSSSEGVNCGYTNFK